MMEQHYSQISTNYNYFYKPFHQAEVPLIIKKLQLEPDDQLLDIGAGTGRLSHWIWKQARLNNPVTCLEPCKELFDIARKVEGVRAVPETVDQFYSHFKDDIMEEEKKLFNKVLLCGMVYHLPNVTESLGQIIDCLPKHGACLVFQQPFNRTSLPFSRLHLQHLAEQSDILDVIISYAKSRNDVITEITNETTTFQIPKSRWYDMIRGHFWSFLRRYTDEEIEESIKEIDKERFSGVKDDENITIQPNYVAIKLIKRYI